MWMYLLTKVPRFNSFFFSGYNDFLLVLVLCHFQVIARFMITTKKKEYVKEPVGACLRNICSFHQMDVYGNDWTSRTKGINSYGAYDQ